jgi:MFS family permease
MSPSGTSAGVPASSNPARDVSLGPSGVAVPPQGGGLGLLATPFRSLRHRNYRLYFFGQLVSLTGTWMQTTALMWLAYELTHQSKWPAIITAAGWIPTFLLGAWGGSLADRWPKRTLLLLTQSALLILALVLAGLVILGAATPSELLVIALANGLVQVVDFPARLTFVMDMVGREDLMNAVGLNSMLFNVTRAIGPAVAGWLLVGLGPGLCFLLNSLSYAAVIWALWLMDTGLPPASHKSRPKASPFAGLAYLIERPGLGILIMLAGVLALCGWPFLALLPALAHGRMEAAGWGYSLMLSSTGFGALAAALAVAAFGSLARHRQFLGFGVAVISIGLLGLAWAHTLLAAVTFCAAVGFGLALFFTTCQGFVQLSAREHNRGLIMGIWAMVLSGALPVGLLIGGPAADYWGVAFVLRCQGWACAAVGLALFCLFAVWKDDSDSLTTETAAVPGGF